MENSARGKRDAPPYWKIFKQCFPQCFNTFFVFFITLSLFPSVQSDIQRADPNFIVPPDYYVTVMCFLTFNVTALVGSSIASLVQWVSKRLAIEKRSWNIKSRKESASCNYSFLQPSKKYLMIPIVLRILYIPLFLLCNYQPRGITRVLPVYIDNDWVYFIIAVTMGMSSGYFSSLSMMYCPR